MKGNFLLIFFLIVFPSFSHKNNLQSTIETDSKFFSQLKSNKLGKIILGLFELASESDYDALFEALEMLSNGLLQKIQTQSDLLNSAEAIHDSTVQNYESTIKNLQLSIADLEQSLNNNLSPELSKVQSNIETLEERIANIQQQILDSTSIRSQEKEDYEQRNKDLTDGINAINEALGLLDSLVTETEESSVALIQTQRQNLLQMKNKLQKKLSLIKNSFKYKPIIEALTQITLNDDYVDQETLQKIISLLIEIRDSLDQMLFDLQEQETTAQTDFEKTMKNSNDDLDLSQRILNDDTEKLADLQSK